MTLKRFLPKTLFGRSLLILGMPLILVQFISIWVFYDRHVDTITTRMAQSLAGEIKTAINHMGHYKTQADLVWILSEVQSNLAIRATYKRGKKLPKIPHRGGDGRVGMALAAAMADQVRRPFLIDNETIPRHIKVTVQIPTGLLEVVASKKKLSTITTDVFVMWSIGSSVVLLLIAALFMRNQVKPIRRLAHAADSFGKGQDVPDFKPSGASEVRQASTAFIIMRDRIKRQIQQRTEMLAGVSHDLRTPLTRMKLQLAMFEGGPEKEELVADVAEMETMVEEYLAFARGEGTEQAVETSLTALLGDVVEAATRNGDAVDLKTRGALKVVLRPNGFKRCLNNLIGNAARHADRISISAARRNRFVEITIDDNGPGIPLEARQDVFRPFYRLDDARSPEAGGAGLGLTIARDVVRGQGGDITLSDSPLGGLRATLRLPV